MTIRFNCPYCNKTLGVADDKAGMVAACPQCKMQVQAPEAHEVVYKPPTLAIAGSTNAGTKGIIRFHCTECGAVHERPTQQGGQKMTCPNCKANVDIPASKL